MGLFNVFRKKEVPAELPSLGLNETSPGSQSQAATQENTQHTSAVLQKLVSSPREQRAEVKEQTATAYKKLPVQGVATTVERNNTVEQQAQALPVQTVEDEKGFFRDLMKELTQDIDSEKLDDVYKNKLLSEDIVHQIKGYWEKQKPELLLHTVGGNLKQKLAEKTDRLHVLEKEWQDAYSILVTKEDQLRKEEKELKGMLSELINLYESSLKDQDSSEKKE